MKNIIITFCAMLLMVIVPIATCADDSIFSDETSLDAICASDDGDSSSENTATEDETTQEGDTFSDVNEDYQDEDHFDDKEIDPALKPTSSEKKENISPSRKEASYNERYLSAAKRVLLATGKGLREIYIKDLKISASDEASLMDTLYSEESICSTISEIGFAEENGLLSYVLIAYEGDESLYESESKTETPASLQNDAEPSAEVSKAIAASLPNVHAKARITKTTEEPDNSLIGALFAIFGYTATIVAGIFKMGGIV